MDYGFFCHSPGCIEDFYHGGVSEANGMYEMMAGVMCELCDWGIALSDGFQASDTIGMLPIIPAVAGKNVDNLVRGISRACSFSEDTLVTTLFGYQEISDIDVGMYVLAFDEETRELGYYPVTAVWSHEDPIIVHLTIDGELIETTPEHPFYTKEGQWVPAIELKTGDLTNSASGKHGHVDSVRVIHLTQTMYNFTVDTAHTYFVGEKQWLVHNDCPIVESAIKHGLPNRGGTGRTTGYLYDENGDLIQEIVSGRNQYSFDNTLVRGDSRNYIIQDHVEAQAAGIMRDLKISEATLVINNHPCPGCDQALPNMIPSNTNLRVVVPDGYDSRGVFDQMYTGN